MLYFFYLCGVKINEDSKFDKVFQSYGMNFYSTEYVNVIRNDKELLDATICPYEGNQEKFLTSTADLVFYSGTRGAGKTGALLMSIYPYIEKEYFSGVIFRNEKKDASGVGGIADESKFFFKQDGTYKSSQTNMCWDFNKGGNLSFEYYSQAYKDFDKRFRGKEFPFIGVDEVNQIPFKHFTFLFSDNRNSYGYPNKIRCTCNPDGDSWVFIFLKGEYRDKDGKVQNKFITNDGMPILENNGKMLYFYKFGDRPDECYWGGTKEEVYLQGKEKMDRIYNNDPQLKKYMKSPAELALSCSLVTGFTSDNRIIMKGGDYTRRLSMMGEEEKERDLIGRWIKHTDTESLVNANDMDAFFDNPEKQITDFRCVTADMSGNGRNDPATLFYWEGFHLADVEFLQVGAETLKLACDKFLEKHNVARENFCFDATSLGSTYSEYFSDAINYVAKMAAFDKKSVLFNGRRTEVSNYENVRAQIFDCLSQRIKARGYSIEHELLYQTFGGKMLVDHFREEYPAIARIQNNEYKFQAIKKIDMKSRVGHSPDFIDCWTLREYIELYRDNKQKKITRKNAWML